LSETPRLAPVASEGPGGVASSSFLVDARRSHTVRGYRLSLAALLALSACGASPVQDKLSLEISSSQLPLQLSTLCADTTCKTLQRLPVQLLYAPGLAKTEQVEFAQYRVDYTLDGVKGKVPYYAAAKQLVLTPGESASLSLDVFGEAQRSFMLKAVGHGMASGIAKITFAGYDHDNAQIFVEAQFEVEIGEIDLGTPSTKPAADAGTTPDAGTTGSPDGGT
jgi:hypothetical protein